MYFSRAASGRARGAVHARAAQAVLRIGRCVDRTMIEQRIERDVSGGRRCERVARRGVAPLIQIATRRRRGHRRLEGGASARQAADNWGRGGVDVRCICVVCSRAVSLSPCVVHAHSHGRYSGGKGGWAGTRSWLGAVARRAPRWCGATKARRAQGTGLPRKYCRKR